MFGKRPDGRRVHKVDPYQAIVPYIMKTRADSMNMFEDSIPCESLDAYIEKRRQDGRELGYLHLMIAATVRLIALRPQLNRFVMNGRIYARPKIWVCFNVHQTLRSEAAGTTIKLCFEGTETLDQIADVVDAAILRETKEKKADNSTDKLAAMIMNLPGPIIRFAVNLLMWMDKHNIMPKAVIDASPFHNSFYVTYLKSLGINHIYHHIYNFGTTGLFLAIGKEKYVPVATDKEHAAIRKCMGLGIVTDERFCDGLYFARSMKQLARLLRNPAQLETPLESKVEDAE